MCSYPMHHLYDEVIVCPACQSRQLRQQQAIKPTISILLFTGAIALIAKVNRWLHG